MRIFLNGDAQDEICGEKEKNMKCLSCEHRFMGESYDAMRGLNWIDLPGPDERLLSLTYRFP